MLNDDLKYALGVALNEASLLGFELDPERALAGVTFAMLSLPADGGPMPDDSRIQFVLRSVGRLAVSLRGGSWDDRTAPVMPVTIDNLLSTVQSFGGLPVYGWDFFDTADRELEQWGDRLSLDWRSPGNAGLRHSLVLFQEGGSRHLDICVWFDTLEVRRPDGTNLPLEEVAARGKRWWDAFFANDPRTEGVGMVPLRPFDDRSP